MVVPRSGWETDDCCSCTCPSITTVSAAAPPAIAQPISSARSFTERIRNLHRSALTIHPAGICQSPVLEVPRRSVTPIMVRRRAAPIWLNDQDVSSAVALRGPALRSRPVPQILRLLHHLDFPHWRL